MDKRVIFQDNLWFRAKPRFANYRLDGRPMISLKPRLGLTSSDDATAKRQEFRWLNEYTGRKGRGVVLGLEWIRRGDFIDRTIGASWLPTFERTCPHGKWFIFYDPILAMAQRGLLAENQPVNFDRPKVFEVWRKDLRYLKRYFSHPQYWRLNDGHPVLYVWAAFALKNSRRAFRHARNRMLYVLADILGTSEIPEFANGVTGFTAAYPGLERRLHTVDELLSFYRGTMTDLAIQADGLGRNFIPAGSCQYDDTAFMTARGLGEEPLRIIANGQPDLEAMLETAWQLSTPVEDTRYLVWGTLNNWAESTSVLPTLKRGKKFRRDRVGNYEFAHLEAIRNVVFPELVRTGTEANDPG